MIKPSIGRVVWFQPAKNPDQPFRDQPHAALVTHVWGERMVNLACFNEAGTPYSSTSVTLLQDDDERPETGYFAEWMPYQKGQAARADAAEAKAEGGQS